MFSLSLLWRLALLLGSGAGLGLLVHAVRPDGLSLREFSTPTSCEGSSSTPVEIDATTAAGFCARTDVLIADTRSSEHYAEGHIADAVHLPCDAQGQVASEALKKLGQAQTLLVYGESSEQASHVAASLHQRFAHTSVFILKGGFEAWMHAGLACASGPCDECQEHK